MRHLIDLTPYFAKSMTDKYVYKNLISLLKYQNKELYNNYVKLLEYEDKKGALIKLNNDLRESNKKIFVSGTEMYKISRILRGFQYTIEKNIVRLWSDIIVSNNTKETGRLIVSNAINSKEIKLINDK